jgi:hypothetical protein
MYRHTMKAPTKKAPDIEVDHRVLTGRVLGLTLKLKSFLQGRGLACLGALI